jgi:histidinol-phosphate aminotransferase
MTLTRRDFCGVLAAGVPVAAAARPRLAFPAPAGPIRLDSNENPYGPSAAARAAIAASVAEANRYPSSADLVAAIARVNGVAPANVLLTVGATEGLYLAAKAFTRPDAALVTAAPTYPAIATATEQLGHPVARLPLTEDGRLDLAGMGAPAREAGVVYLCNPNNPTGTIIEADTLRRFVIRLGAEAPNATIVIGEAYHEYVDDPAYATLVPEAIASPRILVNRTFSKLYGLAGMRLGYLIGQPETLERAAAHRVPIGANVPAIAAALAVLADQAEVRRQRDLTRAGREAAEKFFRGRGWRFHRASANYLFVDVKRPIGEFRTACQAKGLLIGRPYPPAETWARLTIGTPEEMEAAFAILATLL